MDTKEGFARMDRRPEPDPRHVTIRRDVRVRRGVSFHVATAPDHRDPISRELALGVFPPLCRAAFELMDVLVPPSGCVLDLGAHVGTFSLAASASGRRVVSVEPAPGNVELLEASRDANRFDALRIVQAAIADRRGEVGFIPAGPFGHVTRESSPAGGLDMPAIAVDELLEEIGWDRVDFVKMDVEGSEVAGLIGMSRLLRPADAPPILVESNGHTLDFLGETPTSLKATLEAYGYRVYLVDRPRLVPVAVGELQPTTVVDYLAVKRTPIPPRSWRIDTPMSARERVRRVRASFRSGDHERRYIARALDESPGWMAADHGVPVRTHAWYAPWRR
jgi:FkbM family methyltransferase